VPTVISGATPSGSPEKLLPFSAVIILAESYALIEKSVDV